MNTCRPKNVIAYARVSTPGQLSGVSLDAQHEGIKKYAAINGYNIIRTISECRSAFHANRNSEMEQTIRQLEAANPEKIDLIIVFDYDRFSRNIVIAHNWIARLRKRNILVKSVSQNFDYTTPDGRHQLSTYFSMCQMESERIGHRVQTAHNHINNSDTTDMDIDSDTINTNYDGKNKVITDFIIQFRNGDCTIDQLSELLYKIVPDESQIPIELVENDQLVVDVLPNAVTFENIAVILNDYDITYRGQEWTTRNVYYVYKKHCSK